jgi:phage tail-like protein
MAGTKAANANLPINGRESLNSDPTRNFRFLVEFHPYRPDNHPMGKPVNFGFTSVSGLSMAVESIPYREGGMNTTLHQIPGQATFSPITLTRGVHLGNSQAWRWMKRLFTAIGPTSASGYPNYQFRSSVTIHVLQHPVNMGNDTGVAINDTLAMSRNDPIAMSFRAYNAWISSLAYSDLNAGDNAIAVEQMTLVHEGLDMFWENDIAGQKETSAGQAQFGL